MVVRFCFTTPDALLDACGTLTDEQGEELQGVADEWIQHGERVTIEIDTVARTASVVPV